MRSERRSAKKARRGLGRGKMEVVSGGGGASWGDLARRNAQNLEDAAKAQGASGMMLRGEIRAEGAGRNPMIRALLMRMGLFPERSSKVVRRKVRAERVGPPRSPSRWRAVRAVAAGAQASIEESLLIGTTEPVGALGAPLMSKRACKLSAYPARRRRPLGAHGRPR